MHLKENPFATCPVGEHRVGKLIPQRQSQLAKFLPPSQNASPIRELKIGSLAALPPGKGSDSAVGSVQVDSSSSGTLLGASPEASNLPICIRQVLRCTMFPNIICELLLVCAMMICAPPLQVGGRLGQALWWGHVWWACSLTAMRSQSPDVSISPN